MQITREQEVGIWLLLIDYLNLTHERDKIFIGNCPFCKKRNSFACNIQNGFCGCIFCNKNDSTLKNTINKLIQLRNTV